MADRFIFASSIIAAIGSGLIAGVFFAFSTFVMKALRRLPASEGIAAMQAINLAVINPMFLGVFLGTGAVCAVAIVGAVIRWQRQGAGYVVIGGALYLIGSLLLTMVCNVPLNNSLAVVGSNDPDASAKWSDYVNRWSAWNHVRTVAALMSMGLFIMSMCR